MHAAISPVLYRRALSSRYVMQSNLSVSSSAGNLADTLTPSSSSGFLLPSPPPGGEGGPRFFVPPPTTRTSCEGGRSSTDGGSVGGGGGGAGAAGFNFFVPPPAPSAQQQHADPNDVGSQSGVPGQLQDAESLPLPSHENSNSNGWGSATEAAAAHNHSAVTENGARGADNGVPGPSNGAWGEAASAPGAMQYQGEQDGASTWGAMQQGYPQPHGAMQYQQDSAMQQGYPQPHGAMQYQQDSAMQPYEAAAAVDPEGALSYPQPQEAAAAVDAEGALGLSEPPQVEAEPSFAASADGVAAPNGNGGSSDSLGYPQQYADYGQQYSQHGGEQSGQQSAQQGVEQQYGQQYAGEYQQQNEGEQQYIDQYLGQYQPQPYCEQPTHPLEPGQQMHTVSPTPVDAYAGGAAEEQQWGGGRGEPGAEQVDALPQWGAYHPGSTLVAAATDATFASSSVAVAWGGESSGQQQQEEAAAQQQEAAQAPPPLVLHDASLSSSSVALSPPEMLTGGGPKSPSLSTWAAQQQHGADGSPYDGGAGGGGPQPALGSDWHHPNGGGALAGLPGSLGQAARGIQSKGRELFGALAGLVQHHGSGGFGANEGGGDANDLGDDDDEEECGGFDSAMHPGHAAKLDGPLPWELPDHLLYSDQFLTICSTWQRNNPGQLYRPEMLLPPTAAAAAGPDAAAAACAEEEAQRQKGPAAATPAVANDAAVSIDLGALVELDALSQGEPFLVAPALASATTEFVHGSWQRQKQQPTATCESGWQQQQQPPEVTYDGGWQQQQQQHPPADDRDGSVVILQHHQEQQSAAAFNDSLYFQMPVPLAEEAAFDGGTALETQAAAAAPAMGESAAALEMPPVGAQDISSLFPGPADDGWGEADLEGLPTALGPGIESSVPCAGMPLHVEGAEVPLQPLVGHQDPQVFHHDGRYAEDEQGPREGQPEEGMMLPAPATEASLAGLPSHGHQAEASFAGLPDPVELSLVPLHQAPPEADGPPLEEEPTTPPRMQEGGTEGDVEGGGGTTPRQQQQSSLGSAEGELTTPARMGDAAALQKQQQREQPSAGSLEASPWPEEAPPGEEQDGWGDWEGPTEPLPFSGAVPASNAVATEAEAEAVFQAAPVAAAVPGGGSAATEAEAAAPAFATAMPGGAGAEEADEPAFDDGCSFFATDGDEAAEGRSDEAVAPGGPHERAAAAAASSHGVVPLMAVEADIAAVTVTDTVSAATAAGLSGVGLDVAAAVVDAEEREGEAERVQVQAAQVAVYLQQVWRGEGEEEGEGRGRGRETPPAPAERFTRSTPPC